MATSSHPSHKAQVQQLKRIEGQIRGITQMLEEERYCVDILTQIKAARSSLASLEKRILASHLDHCVYRAIASKDPLASEAAIEEIKMLLAKVQT